MPRKNEPTGLAIPQPVLVRERRAEVTEHPGRLRWAIKNPAPGGEGGERWGDTHFASSLAAALRELGQDVVVDRRPEWDRTTGRPRRRRARAARAGRARAPPGPGHPRLGDLAPRRRDGRRAASLRRGGRGERALGRARDARVGHPRRAVAPGDRPGAIPPADGLRDVGARGPVRRQLPARAPPDRPGRTRGGSAAHASTATCGPGSSRTTSWSRGRCPNDRAVGGVRARPVWCSTTTGSTCASHGFVSNRLFDAVASGARVISDDVAGLDGPVRCLGAGLPTAGGPGAPGRRPAVFGDDELRAAAAERVRREHSFAARAETLVRHGGVGRQPGCSTRARGPS